MDVAAMVAENALLKSENSALKANLEAVQFQLEQLKRLVFGAKSERLESLGEAHSGLLFEVDEPPVPEPIQRQITVSVPKAKPKRDGLPAHLPRQIEVIDLPDTHKNCPCCGGQRHVIGEAVSEKLDYVAASVTVRQTRRPKYACRQCQGSIAVAPLPPSPIEQAMAAPGLIAHVSVAKFADHLPLNRQSAILRRDAGIEVPVSTLCDWLLGGADALEPLYAHLVSTLLQTDILHGDDTIVPLRQKEQCAKARTWTYLSPALKLTAYEFTQSRAGAHPRGFLQGWKGGYFIADAYSGYDRLFDNPNIREVGCWSHARRGYYEIAKAASQRGLAHEAVERIAEFFHLEQGWMQLDAQDRWRRRKAELEPRLQAFREWIEAHLPRLLPKSPLARAMGYCANHWGALTRHLEDGRLPLTNNAAERAMRPIAVGRNNWLFAGSVRGGQAAAILLSFIESAKLNQLNAFDYLRDVLTRIPSAKQRDLDVLLPNQWKPA
jgi:transposase